jgi:glutaredoxin
MESKNTIVWSKVQCPFCDMAKTLLKNKGIAFEERMIGVDWTREQLLEAIPQARTVPQIILNGEYIGGYDQLKAHYNKQDNQ